MNGLENTDEAIRWQCVTGAGASKEPLNP